MGGLAVLSEGFAVGSIDNTYEIAPSSGRGPSACDSGVFPELVAPGVNVRTCDLTFGGSFLSSYATGSGTSFAAAHVAGAMALLRSAFPDASVEELQAALQRTALDLGPPGSDDTYGSGLIDLVRAHASLAGRLAPKLREAGEE